MVEGRRTFGPVMLLGLVSAALLAVASAKPWFSVGGDVKLLPGMREPETQAESPLALALALVVLAGWGAMLVTRARARRLIAVVGILAAVGVVAALVTAPFTLPDQIRENKLLADASPTPTAWYVAAAVAAVVALVALAAAWRLAPSWPTMSSRYDAPGTASGAARSRAPETPTELWKALDEGTDPTLGPDG